MSRRRFLGASAATASAVAASTLVGCSGNGGAEPTPQPARGGPPPSEIAARGGVLRLYNFDAVPPDTLDPHQTLLGPIVNMHSAVFSKVLRYDDERNGTIVPDLAGGMPEQPDRTTYIIRLRSGVRFHDALKYRLSHPQTAGRELQAADVKYSIERQINRNSPQARRFFRSGDWTAIDRIDVPDERTLVILMKSPVAPFLNLLAGRHAFVIPREVVDASDQANNDLAMIGTGPFMLESFDPGRVVKLRRNPAWFARDDNADGAGIDRPFLDGCDAYFSPEEDLFERAAFERRATDVATFTDVADVLSERAAKIGDISADEADSCMILAARLLLDRPPFRDDRVRRALHLAIDRMALLQAVFPAGAASALGARLSGPVAPALAQWVLPVDELLKRPGYRSDAGPRDEDVRSARQLWSAALGDQQPGDLKILFAGLPKHVAARAAPVLTAQLRETLGANAVPFVDTTGVALISAQLARNAAAASEGVVSFTFGLEDAGPDLDDAVYSVFRSGQPRNTFRLQDPTLDALLDRSRAEFDNEARRKIGHDIQDYLLANVNARLECCAPISRRLSWGYVRSLHLPVCQGSNYTLADAWLDGTHPAYRDRPA